MKTNLFMCFLALSLLIFSCKKETNNPLSGTQSAVDDDFINRVEKFIDLAQNVKEGKILKSDEKIPIADAISFIDETFNYEYCQSTTNYKEINQISVNVMLPILSIEEKTYLVDAALAYNDAVMQIRSSYIAIADNKKNLLGVKVKQISIDPNGAYITIQVTGIVGIGSAPIVNSNDPFEFWWSEGSNSCDLSITDIGAPEIFESQINQVMNISPGPNYRVVWSQLDDVTLNPLAYPMGDQTPDNFIDYKIYNASVEYGPLDDLTKCIGKQDGINEMYFYRDSAIAVITKELIALNMNFKVIDVKSEASYNQDRIFHYYVVYYGVKTLIYNPDPTYPIGICIE
jgi:hypothetical protein